MIGMFIFMLLTRFFTAFVIMDTAEITEADIDKVIEVFEANPIAKYVISLRQFGMIVQLIMIPALTMAGYFYFRRKVKQEKLSAEVLQFFVAYGFFAFLINAINDAAVFLATLI